MAELHMNIAFCVNNAYVDKLLVVMYSILKNHPTTDVSFYIFSSDMSEKSQKVLAQLKSFKDFRLVVKLVHPKDFDELPLKIDHISMETYFRYKIADWLPQVDKILYLDADTVVKGNFADFYQIDLKNYYIAGVPDLFVMEKEYYKKFHLDTYVNAGVLLMNLKQIRHDHLGDGFIRCTEKLKDQIVYQDQDVINIVCADKICLVDSIYNFTSRNMRREKNKRNLACILHYTGPKKPWLKSRTHLKKIWQRYAEEVQQILNPRPNCWVRFFQWIRGV